MERITELSILLNTIRLDILNIYFDINKFKNTNQYTLNKLYEINKLILYVYDYLEILKEKIKNKNTLKNFENIAIIENMVKRINCEFKTININLSQNVLHENKINSFTDYMDFVINNGYIDFYDYEKICLKIN